MFTHSILTRVKGLFMLLLSMTIVVASGGVFLLLAALSCNNYTFAVVWDKYKQYAIATWKDWTGVVKTGVYVTPRLDALSVGYKGL